MEVFTAATLLALVGKVTSFLKYLTSGQIREAGTQAVVWIAGIVVFMVAAKADIANGFKILGDLTLADMNAWSQALLGASVASGASVIYDVRKAIDDTDSAAEPPLGGQA